MMAYADLLYCNQRTAITKLLLLKDSFTSRFYFCALTNKSRAAQNTTSRSLRQAKPHIRRMEMMASVDSLADN